MKLNLIREPSFLINPLFFASRVDASRLKKAIMYFRLIGYCWAQDAGPSTWFPVSGLSAASKLSASSTENPRLVPWCSSRLTDGVYFEGVWKILGRFFKISLCSCWIVWFNWLSIRSFLLLQVVWKSDRKQALRLRFFNSREKRR